MQQSDYGKESAAATVGVLAVQGGFQRHADMLGCLGVRVRWIKTAPDLNGCVALILPGGESTTMTLLLRKYNLYKPLRDFGANRPVMGTCAGAIMLSGNARDPRVEPLHLMDITVDRNAYGSQVESFVTLIDTPFTGDKHPMKAVFIRAPRLRVESPDVRVLTSYDGCPVIVQQGHLLALAFHPELTADDRIHRFFLQKVAGINDLSMPGNGE